MHLFKKKEYNKQKEQAFTAMELIVVIGIFLLMSTLTLYNYNQHKKQIQRANLAEDVALTLRQAQVYGISASSKTIGTVDFNDKSYTSDFFDAQNGKVQDIAHDRSIRGVSLEIGSDQLILFDDIDRNYRFDKEKDRIIDKRLIHYPGIRFREVRFCRENSCFEAKEGMIYVTFQRPYPDAYIYYAKTKESSLDGPFDTVTIIIGNGHNKESAVEINNIGNIVVS